MVYQCDRESDVASFPNEEDDDDDVSGNANRLRLNGNAREGIKRKKVN